MIVRAIAFASAVVALAAAGPAWSQDRQTQEQRATELQKRLNASPSPRILNGENAKADEIPWQVGLVSRSNAGRIYCGGSFISPTIVLTAGHCVVDLIGNAKLFKIVSGSAKLDDPRMVSHDITHIVAHPRYANISMGSDYDFALIRVAQPYTGRTVELLTSADNDRLAVGTNLQVSGWGNTQAGGNSTVNLQKLDVPVVGRADCNDADSYNGIITSRMICAGFQQGVRDSCNGDSGGPLTMSVGPNQRRLVGVVSFGDSCGKKDKYGVYSRIHAVRSWINSTISQLSQD